MNEKIEEISRQSIIELRANNKDLPALDSFTIEKILSLRADYDKKFAELLIKECARIADKEQDFYDVHNDGELNCNIGVVIKEHFGVK